MSKAPESRPRAVLISDEEVFEQATSTAALLAGWSRVWSNAGAAGGDRVTVERFMRQAALNIARLSRALRKGDYKPGPLRQVAIPKKSGGTRMLSIPCVADRVAQTAFAQALVPLLEQEFEESSFGYRPGRSVKQAVREVSDLRRSGAAYVVDADISGFFDNVPHDRLMDRLAQSMTEGPTTRLIGLWLEHAAPTGRGLPQGSPISPLLANLYLDRLDEAFSKRRMRIVRYADDFVILCENAASAEAALERARRLLHAHGLELHPDKTRVVSFDQGFRFLGHLFVRSLVMKTQDAEEDETARLIRAVAQSDAGEERKRLAAEQKLETLRRGGLRPAFRILYVHEAGRRLSLRNEAFTVEEGETLAGDIVWNELIAIPNSEVDRIEIGPACEAAPEALKLALASETEIAFVNGHGETLGWAADSLAPRAGRHMAQAACVLDEERRLGLARAFVDGRLRNQRALLRRLNRTRKNPAVTKALVEINRLIRRVPHEASLAALMGVEGYATALYWPAFGKLLDYGFRFTVRERDRDEIEDPVNILLNASASLLARDIGSAIIRAGLHPGFGMLHAAADYRDAGIYDLMEEFRAPLAESVVATCVNNRIVGHDMFTRRADGGLRMETPAMRGLIREYERAVEREVKSRQGKHRRTWRGIMVEQAHALAAHVEGRGRYKPYIIDY